MFEQYPYGLYVKKVTGSGRDAQGNPLQGTVDWELVCKCRDDRDRASKTVNVGGVETAFSGYILTPTSCPQIDSGTTVQVREADGTVRMETSVILFRPKQLHCRIWV